MVFKKEKFMFGAAYNDGWDKTKGSKSAWYWNIQCPNENCVSFLLTKQGNIIKANNYGKDKWRCKNCNKVFSGDDSGTVWKRVISVCCQNINCRSYKKYVSGNIMKASNYGKNKDKKRWKCRICGKTFSETFRSPGYRKRISDETLKSIKKLRGKGETIREIASKLGINKNTVMKWVRSV